MCDVRFFCIGTMCEGVASWMSAGARDAGRYR